MLHFVWVDQRKPRDVSLKRGIQINVAILGTGVSVNTLIQINYATLNTVVFYYSRT